MSDSEYQGWIKSFWDGSWLVDGWNAQSAKLVRGFAEAEAAEIAALLKALGDRIAPEWAKANDVRKIDTDMLKQWGTDLQNAAKQSAQHLRDAIVAIEARIASLLQ